MAATTPGRMHRNLRSSWVARAYVFMFVALGGCLTIAVANSVWWRLPQSARTDNPGTLLGVVGLALIVAMLGALAAGAAAGWAVKQGEPVGRLVFPLLLGGIHAFMLLMALPVLVFGR